MRNRSIVRLVAGVGLTLSSVVGCGSSGSDAGPDEYPAQKIYAHADTDGIAGLSSDEFREAFSNMYGWERLSKDSSNPTKRDALADEFFKKYADGGLMSWEKFEVFHRDNSNKYDAS